MTGQLPKRVGESGHAQVRPEKINTFSVLQLTQTTSWKHLLETHTLFTPALLYLAVPLIQDPFDAFQQDTGLQLEPQALVAETGFGLFRGLATQGMHDVYWNYQVLCAPKELVEQLHQWLATVKYLDSARGLLWRPKIQRILVRDDAEYVRTFGALPKCPTVEVAAWALDTTRGTIFYGNADPNDPRGTIPSCFNTEVPVELIAFRDQLTAGTNPYGVESK